MTLNPKFTCPNCYQTFHAQELVKKDSTKPLKWNQITPAPSVHCPHCQQKLKPNIPKKLGSIMAIGFIIFIVLMILEMIFRLLNQQVEDIITYACVIIFFFFLFKLINNIHYEIAD